MVKERIDILELVRKVAAEADVDFLREALAVLVSAIMEAGVTAQVGAGYGERNPQRLTQRNGYRPRTWDTRVGTLELRIPNVRQGSCFHSLLQPRRRSERALLSVVQQAYVEGVSTRRVDDLVKALGCECILKEPGIAHLPGTGCGGGGLSRPAPGQWPLSLPVAGRAHSEG